MDGVVGHPVQLGLAGFQQRDAAFGGKLEGLLDAVVHFDPDGDVQGLRGDAGAECLDDGVAAGDDFLGGTALGAGAGAGAAGAAVPRLAAERSASCLLLCALWYGRSSALGVGPLPSRALRPWPPVPMVGPFFSFDRPATVVGHEFHP